MIAVNVLAIHEKGGFGKGRVLLGLGDEVVLTFVFFLKIFDIGTVVAVGISKFAFDDTLEVHRHFYDLLIYVRRVGAWRVCALGMEDAKGFEFGGLDGCGVVVLVVCQFIVVILS